MRAEIIAVLARNGEISQGQLRVIADKLSSVGIATADIVYVKNLPEMADAAKAAFAKGNMPVFIYSMATRADKAIKNIICQNIGLNLRGSRDCLNSIKRKLAEKDVRYSDEYTYFAVFPDGSKIFENPKGIQNGFLTSASGKVALALPTEQLEIILDEQVLPLFNIAEEKAKSREQLRPADTIQPMQQIPNAEETVGAVDETQTQEQQEDGDALQGKVMVGVCGVGRNELIKRLSGMLKAENPKMSVLSRQEDVQITLTATADTKEQINKILNDAIIELKHRFGNGVYGINIPDIYCAAAKKLNDNRSKIAIADPYTRGELAAGIKKNGFANVISFEENSGTQRTKVNVLGVPEKMIKKKGTVSAEVASAMAAGAKKISGAKVGIAILGVSHGQGDKKLHEGTVFIAIDSEYGSRVKTLNIPEKFTKEQMCKIAAFEAAAQLRLYDETVFADNINGKAVNQMGKASSKTSKKAPRSTKKDKKSFGRKLREYFLPMKGDGFVDVAKKLILMVALVIFVGSMSYIIYYYKNASGTKEMYDGIKDFVIESNDMVNRKDLPKDYPKKYQPKFVNLWKENRDIAGWIKIDNTIVDYPVVQRPGDKNIYYFRKDFSEKYNKYGVPFVDYETDLSKPSANTIVYGHNMADGQMFGVLEQYKSLDFYKSNPVVDFNSVYKDGKYVIFGAFLAATREQDDPFNYHHFVNPKSDTEYNNFIAEVRKRSFYSVPLDINPDDELLTLSTCTYTFYKNGKAYKFPDGRLVVIARKVRDGEDYSSAVLGASWQNALMPKPYYDIDDSTPAVGEKPLEALTLSEASIEMQEGETKTLTYSTTPTKAAKTALKWSSSDPGVASVEKGKITAIKNGTTTITLSTEDGRISASAKVVVGQPAPTNLEKIYFAKDEYNVQKGESIRLNLKTSPTNFDVSTLKLYYMSNNEDIASISQEGYVTAHKLGRTLITVSTTDGKYSAETIVNVLDGVINPTGISIDRNGAQFVDGELHVYEDQSIRLKAIITPSGVTDTDVVWSTSDKKVISVDSTEDGEFTVKGRIGDTAKITVKTEDGNHSDSIKVRIVEGVVAPVKVTGMTLSPNTDFELAVGATKQITVNVTPSNATDRSVTWSTGNTAIATISSSGVVTAHAEGTTYIKAKANDGSGLTAQVNITVKKSVQEVKVKSVTLSASSGTIDVGSTIKLSATISPSNATNRGIKWTSSSDGIATVSGGTVTGKSAGTATITARTDDGGFIAEATITVKKVEKPTVPEAPVEKPTVPETPTEKPPQPEPPAEKPTVPPVEKPTQPENPPQEDKPVQPDVSENPDTTPPDTKVDQVGTTDKPKTVDESPEV